MYETKELRHLLKKYSIKENEIVARGIEKGFPPFFFFLPNIAFLSFRRGIWFCFQGQEKEKVKKKVRKKKVETRLKALAKQMYFDVKVSHLVFESTP